MNRQIISASPKWEGIVNALAKMSPFTRDFANPPLSLKAMRKEAFTGGQVYVMVQGYNSKNDAGELLGFIWSRPMKPRHMPFSTVYYMGVNKYYTHQGIARDLLRHAVALAKEGRVELVCEDGNVAAKEFYHTCGGVPIKTGVVGKDNRPYTRWAFTRETWK